VTICPNGDGRGGFPEPPTANIKIKKKSPTNSKNPIATRIKPILVSVFKKIVSPRKNYSPM
jgi:hypothetical protein